MSDFLTVPVDEPTVVADLNVVPLSSQVLCHRGEQGFYLVGDLSDRVGYSCGPVFPEIGDHAVTLDYHAQFSNAVVKVGNELVGPSALLRVVNLVGCKGPDWSSLPGFGGLGG